MRRRLIAQLRRPFVVCILYVTWYGSQERQLRAHIILPDRLVEEIDGVVGKRKRSHFVEQAVREKLKRESLLKALKETAGMLPADEYPEWETSEKVAAWVRKSRLQDTRRLRNAHRD